MFRRVGTASSGLERETAVIDLKDTAAADPAASDTTDTSSDETSTKGLKASAQLIITGGTFSLDTADDALHSNGDISIAGGTYTIATGDDGIHADNAVTITDCDLTIADSYEGIEGLSIDISGGTIRSKPVMTDSMPQAERTPADLADGAVTPLP